MAHLSQNDKLKLETLLQMGSGYVLDFTNATFAEFFSKDAGIDIYSTYYNFKGESKASRLKAFWEKADPPLVGKVISELLERWKTKKLASGKEITKSEEQLYGECLKIPEKLQETLINGPTSIPIKSSYFPDGTFALFISHRNTEKLLAKKIKDSIKIFGVSSFVAHEDIKPSSEWVKEIEKALFSMDALLALLTKDFSSSFWTNQEIGVAFGREKHILSVKIEEDPQGFISKFQAMKLKGENIEKLGIQIAKDLLNEPKTSDKMITAYFKALGDTESFNQSIKWSILLQYIAKVDKNQMDILINSYSNNSQAYNCVGLKNNISAWLEKKGYQINDGRIIPYE